MYHVWQASSVSDLHIVHRQIEYRVPWNWISLCVESRYTRHTEHRRWKFSSLFFDPGQVLFWVSLFKMNYENSVISWPFISFQDKWKSSVYTVSSCYRQNLCPFLRSVSNHWWLTLKPKWITWVCEQKTGYKSLTEGKFFSRFFCAERLLMSAIILTLRAKC